MPHQHQNLPTIIIPVKTERNRITAANREDRENHFPVETKEKQFPTIKTIKKIRIPQNPKIKRKRNQGGEFLQNLMRTMTKTKQPEKLWKKQMYRVKKKALQEREAMKKVRQKPETADFLLQCGDLSEYVLVYL